jgi:hypothetical protein
LATAVLPVDDNSEALITRVAVADGCTFRSRERFRDARGHSHPAGYSVLFDTANNWIARLAAAHHRAGSRRS